MLPSATILTPSHDPGGKKANSPRPAPPCSTNHRLPAPNKLPARCETVRGPGSPPFLCARLSSKTVRPPPTTHQRSLLPGYRDELMRSLHALARIMAEGNIPGLVVTWIASASLTALKKTDGSHRPVAVGETLRRLIAKALLAAASEDATPYHRPTRLGLGTNNGCEAIVHAVRRWLRKRDNDEKRCVMTVDFLSEIRRETPGLARYCHLCYLNDSFVLLGPEQNGGATRRPLRPTAVRPRPRGSTNAALSSMPLSALRTSSSFFVSASAGKI